jgi:hypothetical protein
VSFWHWFCVGTGQLNVTRNAQRRKIIPFWFNREKQLNKAMRIENIFVFLYLFFTGMMPQYATQGQKKTNGGLGDFHPELAAQLKHCAAGMYV